MAEKEESVNFMELSKTKGRIAKSAMALAIASIIGVILSFVKESIIAYYYGVSAETDAYNISIDTPRIIFTFVSMAISTVIVPVYTKALLENGKQKANYFFQNLTTIVIICYIVLLLIGELSAPFIIQILAPGLDKKTLYLAVSLFRISIPAIGLGLFCKINIGVLNSHRSFLVPSFAPFLFNLAIIFSVVILAEKKGIFAAILGTAVGMALELIFTCYLREKYVKYKPVLNFKDNTTVFALRMAVPVFIGMSVTELNLVADKVIASFFDEGSISALNYASKLSSGISTLFITNITTVIFPEMAAHIANGDKEKAANTYIFSLRIFIIILIPIIVGGIFLSREILTLVYGRGEFDVNAIIKTTPIFCCYFVCLLFTGIRQAGTNFLYSHGNSKIAMKNTVIGVAVNIILNILLSKFLGVPGLALATTLSVVTVSVLLMKSAKHINKYVIYNKLKKLLFQVSFACGIMFAVIGVIKSFLISTGYYDITNNILLFCIIAVVIGICTYALLLLILKVEEVYMFWRFIKNTLKLIIMKRKI